MPFPPAHIVAAAPLARPMGRLGVVSALSIGAMTPDLAYFLPLEIPRWESHSMPGLFWFCLPAGLATWALFVTCVAPLVHDVAPQALRARLPSAWRAGAWPTKQFGAAALCVLIGAATHLAWDSFTHLGTPVTLNTPVLTQLIGTFGGYRVRGVTVLQHTSTLFGFTVLAIWGRSWWRRTQPVPVPPPPTLGVRLVLIVLALGPALWLGGDAAITRFGWPHEPMLKLRQAATGIVMTGGTILMWSLVGVSIAWRVLRTLPSLQGEHERLEPS